MLLHWWQGSSLNLPSQPAAIHRNLRVASVAGSPKVQCKVFGILAFSAIFRIFQLCGSATRMISPSQCHKRLPLALICLHWKVFFRSSNMSLNNIKTVRICNIHTRIYFHAYIYIFPHTGLPVWDSYSFERVAYLGRMILPLSPGLRSSTLGALGRMIFRLVSHCLPLCSG